ncbi:RHS repeat domain-containing protein [Paludibaculum fermentans]|uniref:RHS repeat domain-containing protein n=1 Tax=Paludibaculum fermentans TaxID=1473598 RepID=UPI003EBA486C
MNAQGRLSTVTLGSVVETYEYSVGGLVTKKKVEFQNNDTPLEANYTYDAEGRLASMKYPDVYNLNGTVAETGRTLTYFHGPLGLSALRDSTYPIAPGDRVGVVRNAAAQITQMVVYKPDGTSDTESFTYNVLGQLTQASGRGSNIEYRYSATANDGRITSRKDNVSGEEVSYQYDQLGRLIAASTTGPEWGLAWGYDGFGNRLQQNVTKGTAPSAVFNVDPATNRMTGAGITYDANGNMTGFGTGSGTATYDLFNRMATVTTGNGTEGYVYSAANQRIQITRPTGTVETFFYGLGGELLGVYQRGTKANGHKYFSSASIRVWFAGRMIGSGANSMVTDRLGSVVRSGTEGLSYYPYGEQQSGNATADREKFATYTRDEVSGLDYGWNRYYAQHWGRFTTVDPLKESANLDSPQSFNRYGYVGDDPINSSDPEGLLAVPVDDDGSWNGTAGQLFSASIFEVLEMIKSKESCRKAINAPSTLAAEIRRDEITYVFIDQGHLKYHLNPDGTSTPLDGSPKIADYMEQSVYLSALPPNRQIVFNLGINWDDLTHVAYDYNNAPSKTDGNLLESMANRVETSSLTALQFMKLMILHEFAHSFGKAHPGNTEAAYKIYDKEIWEGCFK